MLKKSTLSKLEHKFLLFATSAIPILIVITTLYGIYQLFFPPPPKLESGITNCYFPSFYEMAFTWSFLICLLTSNVLVLVRKIFLSWLIFFVPLITFCLLVIENVSLYYEHITKYPNSIISEKGLFSTFEPFQIYFFLYILFLFLWHTKVLIQDRMRAKLYNPKLP